WLASGKDLSCHRLPSPSFATATSCRSLRRSRRTTSRSPGRFPGGSPAFTCATAPTPARVGRPEQRTPRRRRVGLAIQREHLGPAHFPRLDLRGREGEALGDRPLEVRVRLLIDLRTGRSLAARCAITLRIATLPPWVCRVGRFGRCSPRGGSGERGR